MFPTVKFQQENDYSGGISENFSTQSRLKFMNEKSASEFWLKPRGFRRHDQTGVGDVHDFFHADRVHRESCRHFSAVHTPFQFCRAFGTSYEADAAVGSRICDAENRRENLFLKKRDIQRAYWIAGIFAADGRAAFFFKGEEIPFFI